MQKQIDWIIHHKNIYTMELPNGFSLYIAANIHQSEKISIGLNCSLLVGTLDFRKGLVLDHSKLDGRFLSRFSNMLRTRKYI